jgi:hypothetical protein
VGGRDVGGDWLTRPPAASAASSWVPHSLLSCHNSSHPLHCWLPPEQVRHREVESIRLEVDSRRRTVLDLAAK